MPKIVGYIKKVPKAWKVVVNKITNAPITGYYGYYVNGEKYIAELAQQAAHQLEKLGDCPPRPTYPAPNWEDEGWRDWCETRNKYEQWQRIYTEANLEVLDTYPVFEADLIFDSYSRGRSSVTMNFTDEGDVSYELGPKCTGQLIESLINGQIKLITLSDGRNAARIQFKVVKQGENVYIEPYYGEYECLKN